jgi:hypothetical protein
MPLECRQLTGGYGDRPIVEAANLALDGGNGSVWWGPMAPVNPLCCVYSAVF